MESFRKLQRFAKYAWFVLTWSIVVVLWGVFLRASKSGDGCGQHWVTCNGEVIPAAPQLKTIIEFSHRVTSSLDGIFIIVLLVWAIVALRNDRNASARRVMWTAVGSFAFVVIEGLLGAGLVLTGNTAENLTPERPFWMAAHLANTLILLAFLTMTAWQASTGKRLSSRTDIKTTGSLIAGAVLIFAVGISGSIAALSSMIFPAGTLAEGLAKDFSPTSHMLLRLRLLHPILAIATGVFLIFITGWLRSERPGNASVARWSTIVSVVVIAQLAFGAATLLSLAPIVMQLGHLLLADAVWISFVIFSAYLLSADESENLA